MLITIEIVRDEWRACYSSDRLAALYDRPHTPVEVLTRKDGAWAYVPNHDRVWTVVRALSHKQQVQFACWCARQCLQHNSDPRALAAIECAEGWLAGTHTQEQCREAAYAADAAYAAAYADDAAYAAADAAYAAAYADDAAAYAADAAYAAADAAYAAYAAADAAYAAAYAAARVSQITYLLQMLQGGAQ